MAQKQQIVAAEIDPVEQHEHGTDILKEGAVAGQAVASDAKTAGAGGAKGGTQRVEPGHSPEEQTQQVDRRQTQVDQIQNGSGFPHPGHQLGHIGAGAFSPQQVHGKTAPSASGGSHGQQKNQHAHAPHPVGKAAPVQQPPGQALQAGEYRGPGGSKAGHRFKQGIDQAPCGSGEVKGQAAQQTHSDPTDSHAHQALLSVKGRRGLPAQQQQYRRHRQGRAQRPQKGSGRLHIPIPQAQGQSGQVKNGLHQKDLREKAADNFTIHSLPRKNVVDLVDFIFSGADHDHCVPPDKTGVAVRDHGGPAPDNTGQ